jgi:hypothetical protein
VPENARKGDERARASNDTAGRGEDVRGEVVGGVADRLADGGRRADLEVVETVLQEREREESVSQHHRKRVEFPLECARKTHRNAAAVLLNVAVGEGDLSNTDEAADSGTSTRAGEVGEDGGGDGGANGGGGEDRGEEGEAKHGVGRGGWV